MKTAKLFVRSANNYDRRAASRAVATDCSQVDTGEKVERTIQSAKDECDLNVMVRRFGVTGVIMGIQPPPAMEEFGEIFDYQTAMNTIRKADESFAAMSAETRARFDNNAARFVKFCTDLDDKGALKNLKELREMGLAVPEAVPGPEKVLTVKVAGGRLDPDSGDVPPKKN